MKTRIKFYAGYYCPQVKELIFWRYLLDVTSPIPGEEYAAFKTLEEAKEYLTKVDYTNHNKVVWKS